MEATPPGLTLSDVSDFITPSEACVKPIKPSSTRGPGVIAFEGDDMAAPAPSTARITLNDCLACKGCVTSAETVLITGQSVQELCAQLDARRAPVVVTVSPAARASLAAHFSLDSAVVAHERLRAALRALGCVDAVDCGLAADLSLCEAAAEFCAHLRAPPSVNRGPLLSATCPGWVCLAEKLHGDAVLRYMSTVRSPQQVQGALVRRWLEPALGQPVYHAAIMPCFDKKLEASRDDFADDGGRRDVDCVVSAGEVAKLLEDKGLGLDDGAQAGWIARAAKNSVAAAAASSVPELQSLGNVDPDQNRLRVSPGGSGGYAEHVFRVAAREVFGAPLAADEPVPWKAGRNADMHEARLVVNGSTVMTVATAYGLRNIQNIVRRVKMGTCPYDYVELMACPSGCLNGGGLPRPNLDRDARAGQRRLEAVRGVHSHSAGAAIVGFPDPATDARLQQLYGPGGLLEGGPLSPKARAMTHTRYHARTDAELDEAGGASGLNMAW